MYQKILVTLDGSRFSEAVLEPVVRLARRTPSQVILLTVGDLKADLEVRARPPVHPAPPELAFVAPPVLSFLMEEKARPIETRNQMYARRRDELLGYLAPHVNRLCEQGVDAVAEVVMGSDAAAAIIEYARTHNVDVIAMATHGRTGIARLLLGSVAEEVVRSGVAPVLLVRPHLEEDEQGHKGAS